MGITLEYLNHKYRSVNNIAYLLLTESLIKKIPEAVLILYVQTNVIKTDG